MNKQPFHPIYKKSKNFIATQSFGFNASDWMMALSFTAIFCACSIMF